MEALHPFRVVDRIRRWRWWVLWATAAYSLRVWAFTPTSPHNAPSGSDRTTPTGDPLSAAARALAQRPEALGGMGSCSHGSS